MKLRGKLLILQSAIAVLAVSLLIINCQRRTPEAVEAQAQEAPETFVVDTGFAGVMDRGWILSEIRSGTETVTLDRAGHAETFGDIFTLRFGDDLVFGTAMPNSFRGPYTLASDQAVTFGPMATTMMAAFMEPEEITEHRFLQYMGRVARWNLAGENLELHTTDEDGAETVLLFVPLEESYGTAD